MLMGVTILGFLRSLAAARGNSGLTDQDLLERFCARHDQAAFEQLLARHGPMVWSVCRNLLTDMHAAEDAFQATFLVLVRRAASIRRRHLLANWLYGVAQRVALRARTVSRRQVAVDGMEMIAARPDSCPGERELAHALHEELGQLPERYRVPLTLCCLQGKSREEAADELGCSLGSFRGRLKRGRERLRQRLSRRGVIVPAAAFAGVLSEKLTAATVPIRLFASTSRAAILLTFGSMGSEVQVSILTLVEGALHAMFMQKVKMISAGVLALIILTAGAGTVVHMRLGIGQIVHAQENAANAEAAKQEDEDPNEFVRLPDEKHQALIAAYQGSDKMKALVTEQLAAALIETEGRWQEFVAGRGNSDIAQGASYRLVQAEFEICAKLDDRLAALKAHARRMKNFEKLNQRRFDHGSVPITELARSKFERARAEIWIERFKLKQQNFSFYLP